jgi:cell division protein ZapB
MEENHDNNIDIASLEARVDELVRLLDQLTHENKTLRDQRTSLAAERSALMDKTEQARTRIESIISRLKAMETRP